jgi:hypothetical protein
MVVTLFQEWIHRDNGFDVYIVANHVVVDEQHDEDDKSYAKIMNVRFFLVLSEQKEKQAPGEQDRQQPRQTKPKAKHGIDERRDENPGGENHDRAQHNQNHRYGDDVRPNAFLFLSHGYTLLVVMY